MRTASVVLVIAMGLLSSGSRAADFPAIGSRPPSALPPDIVRLKNGGMARGTIMESAPGSHVSLLLPDGSQRRFDWADVESAGSAAAPAPQSAPATASATTSTGDFPPDAAPAPAAAPDPRGTGVGGGRVIARVRSRFSPVQLQASGDERVTFHIRTGTARARTSGSMWSGGGVGAWSGVVDQDTFQQLCTAPCSAEVEAGTQRFAVSVEDGKPVPAEAMATIDGPTTLEGEYVSYSGVRAAGWILVVAGGAAVIASPFLARNDCSLSDPDCRPLNIGVFLGVGGAGVAAAIAGFFMTTKQDEARIRVLPGVAVSGGRRGDAAAMVAGRGSAPIGLTGSYSF